MTDFGAALARARQKVAAAAGTTGNSGNIAEIASQVSILAGRPPVAGAPETLATVATGGSDSAPDVATVSTWTHSGSTDGSSENSQPNQRLRSDVASVSTVSSPKSKRQETPQLDILCLARIRNSMAVYEPQASPSRCHVCGGPELPEAPFIAVLNPAVRREDSTAHHWVHSRCHDAHVRRIVERAVALLRADKDFTAGVADV